MGGLVFFEGTIDIEVVLELLSLLIVSPLARSISRNFSTMRIPYVPNPPVTTNAEDAAVVERIEQRRGRSICAPIDFALLHAPAVADGWYVVL